MENHGKYAGERIYIKPELFGIRQLKQFIKHAQSYLDHVSARYVLSNERNEKKNLVVQKKMHLEKIRIKNY